MSKDWWLMMNRVTVYFILVINICTVSCAIAASQFTVSSPDGSLKVYLQTYGNSHPSYYVRRNGQLMLRRSKLEFAYSASSPSRFWNTFQQGRIERGSGTVSSSEKSEHWEPTWGDYSTVHNHYQQAEVSLNLKNVGNIRWLVRVFDDGFAFRFNFADISEDVGYIRERSHFRISPYASVWAANGIENLVGPTRLLRYNYVSRKDRPQTGNGRTFGAETPITVKLRSKLYLAFHEANLIQGDPVSVKYAGSLRGIRYETVNDMQRLGAHSMFTSTSIMRNAAKSEDGSCCTTCSAWRTVVIAQRPSGLVEATMPLNLNLPSVIPGDLSWIQTGKAMWDWRTRGAIAPDGHVYNQDDESLKRMIRFAETNSLDFLLIDGGWAAFDPDSPSGRGTAKSLRREDILPATPRDGLDVQGVVSYANARGIGVFLYINDVTLRNHGISTTLDTYKSWGVRGIKHGFPMFSPEKDTLEFQTEVMAHCAERQLLYVVHEPVKPTRLEVMFPNLLSTEYTNSMFDNPERPAATPREVVTYPFVHGLTGPVDRSPGIFDIDGAILLPKIHRQIPSTIVAQVAQGLIFRTGFWSFVDIPENFEALDELFEFVRKVPMSFEEYRILQGEIGKYMVVRAKVGASYFLAGLCNQYGRHITLNLEFLFQPKPSTHSEYLATFYLDDPEAHYSFPGPKTKVEAKRKGIPITKRITRRGRFEIKKETLSSMDESHKKRITMRPGGGFALWLRPAGN